MIEKQLSMFLENKPGVLASVCKALAEHDVNIRGMSISDTVDHAVVRRERQNFDPAGHYSRPDVARLVLDRRRLSTLEEADDG